MKDVLRVFQFIEWHYLAGNAGLSGISQTKKQSKDKTVTSIYTHSIQFRQEQK